MEIEGFSHIDNIYITINLCEKTRKYPKKHDIFSLFISYCLYKN